MTPERFRRVEQLFAAARELPIESREAFVAAECGGDAALRDEVRALLEHDGSPKAFLDTGQMKSEFKLSADGQTQRAASGVPERIGPYRVKRLIGEGGMGVVYEAEQESPRRVVALKVLRPGRSGGDVLKRFENEAHVLGRLQHPGIAQIYEAGAAEIMGVRQMYLAMEFIDGQSLMDFARERKLDKRQRLELLARVCDAVQHAHQKGVIHRDLKPGNILVVESGAADRGGDGGGPPRSRSYPSPTSLGADVRVGGQPKVLDFGVARVLDADAPLTTVETSPGQLVGTLPYMSPEQVSGSDDVDTRSDVYALGVLAHQLLTDRLPYDLKNRPLPEAARIICDDPPTRLSAIDRQLRGDVETIVARALEKNKRRRYPSAAELAADIRAYLAGAPIAARRDSAWYVVQNTLRRYRIVAALTLGLALVSLAALVVVSVLYQRAIRAEQVARLESERARQEFDRAQLEMQKSAQVNDFLKHMLQAADPRAALGADVRVRDVLDAAAQDVANSLADMPAVQGTVRTTIGSTYNSLGLFDAALEQYTAAEALLRKAYPQGHKDLADVIGQLAVMAAQRGDLDLSERLARDAEAMFRQTVGENHFHTLWAKMNVAGVLGEKGDLAAAEKLQNEVLAGLRVAELSAVDVRQNAPIAAAQNQLGMTLFRQKRYDEAEVAYRNAIAQFRHDQREPSPTLAATINNLAANLKERGDTKAAIGYYNESLAMIREIMGDDHPDVARALNNLGILLNDTGDVAAAEALHREALAIRRAKLPPGDVQISDTLVALGADLIDLNRAAEAEPLLREAVEIRQAAIPTHWKTQSATSVLGGALTALGRFDEAEPLLTQAYDKLVELRGPTNSATIEALKRVVRLYEAWQKPDKLEGWRKRLPDAE